MSGQLLPDHVRVDLDAVSCEAWRACADVLYGTGSPRSAVPLLRRYPGCLLVSLRDGRGWCVTLARIVRADSEGALVCVLQVRTGVLSRRDHALLASRFYGRLVAGGCGSAGRWAAVLRAAPDRAVGRSGGGRPAG